MRSLKAVGLTGLVAVAITGCGANGHASPRAAAAVRVAVSHYAEAVGQRHYAATCALLSPHLLAEIARKTHGASCPLLMRITPSFVRNNEAHILANAGSSSHVSITGDNAKFVASGRIREPATVQVQAVKVHQPAVISAKVVLRLRFHDGRWLINGFNMSTGPA